VKTSTKRPDPKLEEFALMVQDMRRKQRKLRDGSASPSRTFRSELADLERRVCRRPSGFWRRRMNPLTERELEYLAVAISNYGDVQMHVRGRAAELLDLAEKLGVGDMLFKGLKKLMDNRRKLAIAAQIAAGVPQ
jgi:hypothetical protein